MRCIRKAAVWLVLTALIVSVLGSCSKEKDPVIPPETTETQQPDTTEAETTEAESTEPDSVQTRPVNEPGPPAIAIASTVARSSSIIPASSSNIGSKVWECVFL